MKLIRLSALPFIAVVLLGTTAYAQIVKTPARVSTPKAYDTILQNAFECRGVASKIDLALQARQITTDGQTPTELDPPITVFGFKVSKVTVFRDSGEDVYASYIPGSGTTKVAILAAVKKANWPGAKAITLASTPDGTRVACSIAPGPASDSSATD
jgi:hypothetical protein